MSNMRSDSFDVDLFETRLESLKDTQEGIQQMSSWCLQQRAHHKKIVASWLNVFKKVRVEHRLVLFYLANDVIQYSKRKHYEFVESWATALQRATTMVRDEKVKGKILRIFNIWEQREIYSDEFIGDLHGLLNINPSKKSQPPPESTDDFQNYTLISNIRECVELSNATDLSFKKLPRAPCSDIESIKQQLKDKSHSEDVEKEIERYIAYIEMYNKNLQSEIKCRKKVLTNLDTAIKFYSNQRGEVKVVVGAYKNFGSRIKLVKKKIDEIIPTLTSPIPSPDINAPSPEPDADLQLPDEPDNTISMNMFTKSSFNGYSSYLDGNLPFDINDFKRDDVKINTSMSSTASQPIEVIASRPDNQNDSFNSSVEYYKPESISAYPGGGNVEIPGLSPMPVPPVLSEYTSLARTAQQYGILQVPHPPIFGNTSLHSDYSSLISTYSSNSYNVENGNRSGNTSGGTANSGISLMPPPPLPPNAITAPTVGGSDGGSVGGSVAGQPNGDDGGGGDFNSTWDMNMSWTQLNSSNASSVPSFNDNEAEVSPAAFEHKQKTKDEAGGNVLYGGHQNSLGATQDVDHRQIHLSTVAATLGLKLGLSTEKSRQLDIDHRNLISLTGSPGVNDETSTREKKSWLSSADKDFRTNTGDVDYRSIGQAITTINTSPLTNPSIIGNMEPPPLPPGFLGFGVMESPNKVLTPVEESVSPQKSDNSTLSESQLDETGGGEGGGAGGGGGGEGGGGGVGTSSVSGYDPTDMVVDMDMSDEDLEDIFREVNEGIENQEQPEPTLTSPATDVSPEKPPNTEKTGEEDPQKQQEQQVQQQDQQQDQQQQELKQEEQKQPLAPPPPTPPPALNARPPLLETPSEFVQPNDMWEQPPDDGSDLSTIDLPPFMGPGVGMENMPEQHHPAQNPHDAWNHPMPYRGGGGGGPMYPPPFAPMYPEMQQQHDPAMHFPHPHQQQFQPPFMVESPHGGGGRGGRGRGWGHSPHNPFRNAQRPPRGGGSPYFHNRRGFGGGGVGMRGGYRGKFRGNAWI